jgi:autotransporter-associated beta strand protein
MDTPMLSRSGRSLAFAFAALLAAANAAQAQQYWNTNGTSALITAANWGTVPAGPFTNAYSAATDMQFTANSTIAYVTTTDIANVIVNPGVSVTWTPAGTLTTGGNVRTLTLGAGSVLDFGNQSVSTAAGTGFNFTGNGVMFSSNGNAYTGGFSISGGTMVIGGVNAMGAGGTLTINNGSTLAANATRDLSGKFTAITVGGNFTLGAATTGVASGNAVASANLTFNAPMDFGAATRTITLGGTGVYTLGGIISGAPGTGLTLNSASGSGTLTLSAANTYTGPTTITRGTLNLAGAATLTTSSGFTIATGSALTLTNTNATDASIDRVPNGTAITGNGFTLNLANTSSATVYSETVGSVDLVNGLTTFLFTTNAASTGSQTLTLSGLTRTGATNASAVNFASNSGVNATKNMIFVTGATATPAGQIIGPWATTGNTGGANEYAVFTATGQVLPAGIAASTEDLWSTAANAYHNSAVAQTLTGTRTITALRNTGTTATLTLATGANLETYGIINGATTLFTIAPGTGGVLTTPTGGGYLYLNAGNATTGGAMTVNAPINDNGVVTLVKTGLGTLTLNATTSTFSGGTIINSGTATFANNAWGTTGNFTFNGNGTLDVTTNTTTYNFNGTVDVRAGVTGTILGATARVYNFNTLTGSGNLNFASVAGATNVNFATDASGFTGAITLASTSAGNFVISVPNLGDGVGAGNLRIAQGNFGQAQTFRLSGGTTSTVFNHRQIEFFSAAANTVFSIENSNASAAATFVINTPLLNATSTTKTLQLQGSNTGANTFAGSISNGLGGGAVTVIKAGTGVWNITGNMTNTGGVTVMGNGSTLNLSGINTYRGTTTIGTGNPNSVLNIQGLQALSPNTLINLVSNSTPAGTLRLLDDAAGTTLLPNVLTQDSANSTINFIVFVGNNNTANGGTSTGTTTGSTISLSKITASALSNSKLIYGFRAEGANNYTLGIGNVEIPAFLATTFTSATSWKWQLTANTAPISITGTVQQLAGSTSTTLLTQQLELTGTNTASVISGSIRDSLDATPRPLQVLKIGAATWTLTGDNTHSGGTTLSGATAGSRLNINSATALGTGTFTITSGDNATINNTSGTAIVNANNNAMTWNNNFTFAGSNSLNLGTGPVTLSGNRTVTVNGTGTLTIGGVISGAFGLTVGGNGTMSLTGASTFTGTVAIGNNAAASLKLQVNALANLSTASPLGAPTTAANGIIQIGATSQPSTLEFINLAADQSTDRQVRIGNNANGSGGAIIVNNDPTFAVSFSNAAFNVAATGITSTNRTLTLGGTNTAANTIAGAIINNTGTAPFGLVSLSKIGTGTWVLEGTNTYTGATTVSAGTLSMSTAGTPGATTSNLNVNNPNTGPGTDVVLNLATTIDTTVGRLSGTIDVPSSGVNTATINTGGVERLFTINQTAAATYPGVIAGAGSVRLGSLSTAALTLTGANTYTGGTVVVAGTLLANTPATNSATGTSAVTVTGGTLGGTGRIAGAITLNGGTLAPGDATNAGVLTTASLPILMTGGMTFNLTSGTANASQLNITAAGTLDLGSALTLAVTAFTGATDPAAFTLIASTGSSVIGSFSGFAEGSTVFTNTGTGTPYNIYYGTFPGHAGSVVLAPIPEPAVLLAVLAVCVARRRQRA